MNLRAAKENVGVHCASPRNTLFRRGNILWLWPNWVCFRSLHRNIQIFCYSNGGSSNNTATSSSNKETYPISQNQLIFKMEKFHRCWKTKMLRRRQQRLGVGCSLICPTCVSSAPHTTWAKFKGHIDCPTRNGQEKNQSYIFFTEKTSDFPNIQFCFPVKRSRYKYIYIYLDWKLSRYWLIENNNAKKKQRWKNEDTLRAFELWDTCE